MTRREKFIFWFFNEFHETPLFRRMSETSEDSPHHRERNIGVHTNMVVGQYLSFADFDVVNEGWSDERLAGAFACAFHDVGKPLSAARNGPKFTPERGNYKSFGGHELISARLWEDWATKNWKMLSKQFNVNPNFIYTVGWMIEHHLPWGIKKTEKRLAIAKTVARLCGHSSYYDMLEADTLGRIADDAEEKIEKVAAWIDEFRTLAEDQRHIERNLEGRPVLYVLIGASGTGKSTFRNQLNVSHNFSFDDFRHELYPGNYDEAWQAAAEDNQFKSKANARFVEMLKSGEHVCMDTAISSTKVRRFYLTEARRKGYWVVGVLFPVDIDTIIARQESRPDKTVAEHIVRSQYMGLQLPSYGDFDEVLVVPSNLP